MIRTEQFTFNSFSTRCSIVWDDSLCCAFVDPCFTSGQERSRLVSFVEKNSLRPVCIMLTHAHFDHIYGVSDLARTYGIPVCMHERETATIQDTNPILCQAFYLPEPDTSFTSADVLRTVNEGDIIEVGGLRFEVIETPGHTKGGICLLERSSKLMFTGDTLFAGAIGRTDHPGGDYDVLMRSIFEKLMHLDGDIKVIPGHGPESDIATERMTNPFLLPFNEPLD